MLRSAFRGLGLMIVSAALVGGAAPALGQDSIPGAPPTTHIRLWNGDALDQSAMVALGGIRDFPNNANYDSVVAYPSTNNAGNVVFAALDDVTEKLVAPGAFFGFNAADVPFPSRPQMDDAGRIVVRDGPGAINGATPGPIRLYGSSLALDRNVACPPPGSR